jgi:molybdopterin/thiamine biosynthesis adenylyltransferase
MTKCVLRISRDDFCALTRHLFPGDRDEHGAVLLAGISQNSDGKRLQVREVHYAIDGTDYIEGKRGYRQLTATFIHRMITRARDEQLVYLAVHNHGSDLSVTFSEVDFESHERGYPALLQIARGMPVGAVVMGHRSMEADIWLPDRSRLSLERAVVVGNTIQHVTPSPVVSRHMSSACTPFDRQVRMFGIVGQEELARCRVGIIGLGGVGSLVAEYLARLGVGHFVLVDDDEIDETNLSRVVGASLADVVARESKIAISKRVIGNANRIAKTQLLKGDVSRESVAKLLTHCDYLFLAADSMRARLVFNALVHQYLIPGVQLGSKIHVDSVDGKLADVMCANRPVRPGKGCLWCNQLIDPTALAKEAKSDEERKEQAYGVEEPNPSVISLNAVAAAHGVNDFLLDYLGLRAESEMLHYEHFHFLNRSRQLVQPRKTVDCIECSAHGLRYGRGDLVELPCGEG